MRFQIDATVIFLLESWRNLIGGTVSSSHQESNIQILNKQPALIATVLQPDLGY